MLYRVVDESEIRSLIAAFMESYEVMAPKQGPQGVNFGAVSSPEEVVLDYVETTVSPKKYFLPSKEDLFLFDAITNEVLPSKREFPKRVVFGMHSCDINALNRLDLVFKDCARPDPYYVARREATIIVGISCMPGKDCFCRLWGADEARYGYDLFLSNIGGKYLVSMAGVEATNILERACDPREATDEERQAFRNTTRKRQESFNKDIPEIQEVALLMDAFHKDPFWEELGSRCLGCTACAAVCPSCFCFDIVDELEPDGCTGTRVRIQDSCCSPDFATVAGGHNFRPDGRTRVRHRMYHKLNGFLMTRDRMLCVGCGRCVRACKAGINPIEVLKFFERKGLEHDE